MTAPTMQALLAAGAPYVKDELAQVERLLAERLQSDIPVVADLGRYLLGSGGKRFRPALVILFYKLLGAKGPRRAAIELAAVIEMIHLATLAHDDVIDQAPERRGRASLWARSSNRSAVLEGDFIFSRAFRLLNPHPYRVREIVIEATEQVLEGELLQESLRGRLPTVEEYKQVIAGKTAALIRAACAVGALCGEPELSEEHLQAIQQAGQLLGIAYQMIDDLLDVFGDECLGKPRWIDQEGGWLTWPYIQLIKQSSDRAIAERLQQGPIDEPDRQRILQEMARYRIREQFLERARAAIEEAKVQLRWLADSELKALLLDSFDFVVQRDR